MMFDQATGRRIRDFRMTQPRFTGSFLAGLLSALPVLPATGANAAANQSSRTFDVARAGGGQSVRLVGVLLDKGGGSPAQLVSGQRYGYQVVVVPIRRAVATRSLSGAAPPQRNPRLVFRFVGLGNWATIGAAHGTLGQSFCRRRYRIHRVRLSDGRMAVDFGPCSVVRLTFTPTRVGHQRFMVEADAVAIQHGKYRVEGQRGNTLAWSGTVRR
jgi:hypothetical protein